MKHLTQRGSTLIEFALGLLIFLMFLLGVVDFSRLLYTWTAANEATRAGARYAVVCDDQNRQTKVLQHMQHRLPQITAVDVIWKPDSCTTATCKSVTVSIPKDGLKFQWIAPIVGSAAQTVIGMQGFSTTLPREIMYQDSNAQSDCTP
ncbi:pilus assembly protein [Comamonas thiooxydans]|uniref:Pilus assembly protein n=1 Tax=Comamonas thiooxydans TaxID=363952 RepID=A0AA42Q448_9BURK|nr:TadE/TadG family type IV pilus assembly protein [Comamonas thiooxydans]MDH1336687.1 pilus assembly protein [Comamonas thiooxydans]MDH1742735.1 pilus assembly protein [Comamonas thiooxydans]MDH1789118.1 pilus assembly protein [Comamonas thiooxydans]